MQASTTTTHGGLRGLLGELDRLHAAGAPAVLGIVVATEGSTYQKRGALVLLARDGLRHGVISGGCLELELERRAQAAFASGRAALVDFDTRSDEDLVFGSGTGCRGRVHLLLLPQPPGAPLQQALREAAAAGVPLQVELVLAGAALGSGRAASDDPATMLRTTWTWDASGGVLAGALDAAPCRLRVAPPPRLLLLGAGPETSALLGLADRLGWHTTVVEHRGRWSAFARAARADVTIEQPPRAACAQLDGTRYDAVVVMSHNYALDHEYLRWCAQGECRYVGLLGPPARRDALLAELGAAAEALRSRLRAPVGLDLGGSGPEAIALAIGAELQRLFSGPAA